MKNAKIKQMFINVLFIVLAFTVQNCVFPLLPFLAATPNLLLILTFSFGFIHGRNAGMAYGVLSGLLLDLFYSGPFGFYTLIYLYIGYVNGIFTKYYYEDYINLPLILSVLNGLWYSMYVYVFRFLIRGRLDLPYYFRNIMLPEIIFTSVTTLLIYRLFLSASRRVLLYLTGILDEIVHRLERIVILLALLVNLHGFLKVLHHVLGGGRGMHHVLGGVHDALRDVGRVYHRPLCACPARKEQAQAGNHCYSCSHSTLDFSGCCQSCSPTGFSGCGFTRT